MELFIKGQKHLYKTLDYYFKLFNFHPVNPKVLDVGCGDACIAEVVFIKKIYETFNLNPDFTLNDKFSVNCLAPKLFFGDSVLFIDGDARDLTGDYGLIIIRHPDLEVSETKELEWCEVFDNLRNLMSDESLLLATHFHSFGFLKLIEHLSKYFKLRGGLNPYYGPLIEGNVYFDKYVVLGYR